MQISNHAFYPSDLKHLQIEKHNRIIGFRYKIKFLDQPREKMLKFHAAFVKDKG